MRRIWSFLIRLIAYCLRVVSRPERQLYQAYFTSDEVAVILDKAPFTVREWARHGRIRAQKRRSEKRGVGAWMISQAEVTRICEEGLLPPPESPG